VHFTSSSPLYPGPPLPTAHASGRVGASFSSLSSTSTGTAARYHHFAPTPNHSATTASPAPLRLLPAASAAPAPAPATWPSPWRRPSPPSPPSPSRYARSAPPPAPAPISRLICRLRDLVMRRRNAALARLLQPRGPRIGPGSLLHCLFACLQSFERLVKWEGFCYRNWVSAKSEWNHEGCLVVAYVNMWG